MNNSYWVEVKLAVPENEGELIAEFLIEEGAGGIVYLDPQIQRESTLKDDEYFGKEILESLPQQYGLKAYFPLDDRVGERIERVKERISKVLGDTPVFELKQVQEEDWAEAWKAYFKPEHIGKVVIKPSWEEYFPTPDETVIELDPGMAFGTGTHPTTRLCAGLLQEIDPQPATMLDIGTGSGILALVAAKLGINQVTATDIDPMAVKIATENVQRNQVESQVRVIEGNLLNQMEPTEKYDLVVANIISNAILTLIPDLAKVIKPGGKFLASGIIEERLPEIEASLDQHGYQPLKIVLSEGWAGVLAILKI